jgi:hypothetical protein
VKRVHSERVRHASRNADSASFYIDVMAKRVTLSWHFVTHIVPLGNELVVYKLKSKLGVEGVARGVVVYPQ